MDNFAARLVDRLGTGSFLADAATGETVAAAELPDAIAGFAAGFAAAGLSGGDRVLIGCEPTPVSCLAYLGAMYGGLVPVPVQERVLETSGAGILRQASARALWTAAPSSGDRARGESCLRLHGRLDREYLGRAPPASCGEHDLAALMPTSGSTGAPRLVRVTHGNLIANTEAIIRSQRLDSRDRALLILPLSYCFGASVLHTHLYEGGGVVVDRRFMFPDKVLRAITEFACTTFAGVPTVYNILLRRSNIRSIPLPTLRRFLQAGGALPCDRVSEMIEIAPHVEFFVMYGQTEATSRISCLSPGRVAEKPGSVGLPLDNVQVRIVAESGADAGANEPGEIRVSGGSVCGGYFDDGEATAERFRDGWLLTGDIGYRDPDGYLWVAGRKSDLIKMCGVRVSLAEIESRISAVRGVVECAATSVPHVEAGEALALYVVAESDTNVLAAEMRRAMPSEWICRRINVVEELPKGPNGKIARSLLEHLTPVEVIEWAAGRAGVAS